MTTKTAMRLIDFKDAVYQGVTRLQERLESETVRVGNARWILAGLDRYVVGLTPEFTVTVRVTFESSRPDADISWTAAKGYVYALAMGAADLVMRGGLIEGPRRFIPVGSEARTVASLGLMDMKVTVTVGERS